jgi:DNA-binding response OmpR family regulator
MHVSSLTCLSVCQDDVISKPFRIPELMPKIEELVKKFGLPAAEGDDDDIE